MNTDDYTDCDDLTTEIVDEVGEAGAEDSQIISLARFREERLRVVAMPRVVAVTGGKGGVGKSTVAANLAAAFVLRKARTLAVDADFGMADLNLLLGVAPDYSVLDVLKGLPVREAIVKAHGVDLLPGLNGSAALANLEIDDRRRVLAAVDGLEEDYDACIIDAPPGIGDTGLDMVAAASHVVVVLSPEPVSLADAYSCLKALYVRHRISRAYVVVNTVGSIDEADETFWRLRTIVDRFLGIELQQLPFIPRDASVSTTSALGVPIVQHSPDSPAARAIRTIAHELSRIDPNPAAEDLRLFRNRIWSQGERAEIREAADR